MTDKPTRPSLAYASHRDEPAGRWGLWGYGASPPSDTHVCIRARPDLQLEAAVGVVADRNVEFLVNGSAVLGIGSVQFGNDPFELLDERSNLLSGHTSVAALEAELELGGFTFELHLLDPPGHDRGVSAGFERVAIAGEFGVHSLSLRRTASSRVCSAGSGPNVDSSKARVASMWSSVNCPASPSSTAGGIEASLT